MNSSYKFDTIDRLYIVYLQLYLHEFSFFRQSKYFLTVIAENLCKRAFVIYSSSRFFPLSTFSICANKRPTFYSVTRSNEKFCSFVCSTMQYNSRTVCFILGVFFTIIITYYFSNTIKRLRNPIESFICEKKNRFFIPTAPLSNDSFDVYRKENLEAYCSIIPIPKTTWQKPQRYAESDVVFVIFTASKFFHNRATAMRDTWLSRISNYYYLSATPYPYLPVTVVPGAGEDKLSNMKKLFYGLQMIYKQQMRLPIEKRQKWFYIIGCDTFILPHHLLKRLEKYDYTQPYLIGGHSGHHGCLGKSRSQIEVEFPSGGAGFFFSMKLLENMQPYLTDYVENIWPNNSEISDVALACLAKELGVSLTKEIAFWAHPPAKVLRGNGHKVFHEHSEPNGFHYIKPDEMYALDEFYVNQHMDRLINDKNWEEFIEYTRRFVSSHYVLLRKKRKECTLPPIGDEVKLPKN